MILIISNPLHEFKIEKDTTFAIIQALHAQRIALSHALIHDLLVQDNRVLVRQTPFIIKEKQTNQWYQLQRQRLTPLNDFQAILVRTDPPFNSQYLYGTQLLSVSGHQAVFNHPQGLRDYNEKLAILHFPSWITSTIVTAHLTDINHFLQQEKDIIVKPLNGMGGKEIYRLTLHDPNKNSILEFLTRGQTRSIMAQRYIPEVIKGDKRVLLIDGTVIPYALARIPRSGETRANLAAGGKGVAQPLSHRDWEIAKDLAAILKAKGIFLAGLDIIGDYLTEVNVTSPTGFQEIMQQTDCNVANIFVQAILTRCES